MLLPTPISFFKTNFFVFHANMRNSTDEEVLFSVDRIGMQHARLLTVAVACTKGCKRSLPSVPCDGNPCSCYAVPDEPPGIGLMRTRVG